MKKTPRKGARPKTRSRLDGHRLRLEERPATDDVDAILDKLGASDIAMQPEDGGYDPYDKRRSLPDNAAGRDRTAPRRGNRA